MENVNTSQVTLPSDREVRVVRRFRAPPALVYRAYTEPALMQRWLIGYPGWTMPVCEMDVRVGGAYRWRWRNEESGAEFGFHGVFREVEAAARIVHTQIYDPGDIGGDMGDEAIVTLELVRDGEGTLVTTTIDFGSKAARDAAMSTGMTDGMEANYGVLDRLLAAESPAP